MATDDRHQDHRSRLTGGLILLGIGAIFLLRNLGYLPRLDLLWPAILIVIGGALVVSAIFRLGSSGRV